MKKEYILLMPNPVDGWHSREDRSIVIEAKTRDLARKLAWKISTTTGAAFKLFDTDEGLQEYIGNSGVPNARESRQRRALINIFMAGYKYHETTR